MTPYLAIFGGALLGSAHCIGMCGGFAAAIGASKPNLRAVFPRQLIYTAGRIFTYAFLGALAGFAGLRLSQFESSLLNAQRVFSIIAGLVMLGVGISALGLIKKKRAGPSRIGKLFAPIFNHFLNGSANTAYFAAGIATGFLPCGLVYAFLALAIAAADVLDGMLIMTCFGLGTAPTMIAIGCGSTLLSATQRSRIFRVAGVMMLIMGSVTIYRAIPHEDSCCQPPAKATASTSESTL